MMTEFDEKRVEPNSGLGKAFSYMLKHWEPLTLFFRVPGAPLDNNSVNKPSRWPYAIGRIASFIAPCTAPISAMSS